jgi:uncharacterized membrane protein
MTSIATRLEQIEGRLVAIERALNLPTPSSTQAEVEEPVGTEPAESAPAVSQFDRLVAETRALERGTTAGTRSELPTATTILGWGGMAALTLAAAYLVRLAITAGWLTPVRQIVLATVMGVALIFLGLNLRKRNAAYAALLPGCGVVILFLATYGAHLYHHLIGATPATAAVVLISLLALWLGRIFEGEFYSLFAVVGSYTGPLLLSNLREDPTDLTIYFSAWSLLYCWYAVTVGCRQIYLLAAYLAFIIFDLLWKMGSSADWVTPVAFQLIQFLIFSSTVVVYSIVNRAPLGLSEAKVHIPLLLLFYFVQYAALRQHLPQWAPWISFASLGVLLILYSAARSRLNTSIVAGRLVVAIYAAVVLLHAGYFELLPGHLRPWAGLVATIGLTAYAASRYERALQWWPIFAAGGVVFFINYVRLLFGWELTEVHGYKVLIPVYAVALYAGYWLLRRQPNSEQYQRALLYMGHVNVMAGAGQIIEGRIAMSLVWGTLAVATLLTALRLRDKPLARSALFVFAAFAVKVVWFDLSGSEPLVRIGCLLLLGASLYSGGLLYQKVDRLTAPN